MVLVADDLDRENEGDLIVAAEKITRKQVAFMVQHCTGIVCVALAPDLCDKLALPPMVEQNEDYMGTNFCVTCDAKGTTTSVSAADRCATIRALGTTGLGCHFARPFSTPIMILHINENWVRKMILLWPPRRQPRHRRRRPRPPGPHLPTALPPGRGPRPRRAHRGLR